MHGARCIGDEEHGFGYPRFAEREPGARPGGVHHCETAPIVARRRRGSRRHGEAAR
jgi:hypothetical protein